VRVDRRAHGLATMPQRPKEGTPGWTSTFTVCCYRNEPAYTLYCEPEGATREVLPGDVLTLTFSGPVAHGFEIARVADGLMLCRLGNSDLQIEDKRGRSLSW
jgi:hypothetical protein